MDQIHDDIRRCCDYLDSNKVTERKKSCSDLKDYLHRQDVKHLLNRNSENNVGITWDAVLHSSYRALQKEADRMRDEVNKGGKQSLNKLTQIKLSINGLISSVVSQANSGGVQRLSLASLLQYVLNILHEVFYRRHFGTTFLQILYDILKCHSYCMKISHDNWKDLLHICEQMCHNTPPEMDKKLVLITLSLIIQKGANLSFLSLTVKNKFPFIVECIKADAKTLNLQEDLANLALTVCQTLMYESRMAICKFGEEVMADLRNMYDFRIDGRKKELLLEWYVLQVGAHHPCGVRRGNAAAYADQWDVWLKQLGWMYQLVIRELASVLHQRHTRQLNTTFVTLAVAVWRQMFEKDAREILDMSLISNLGDNSIIEGNPCKRIRLETGVPAVLDKLMMTPQQEMWPWLTVLSATVKEYPDLISEQDLVSLLQFCADQLLTCKANNTIESLYRCCYRLLFAQSTKPSEFLDVVKLKGLWDSLWETTLRAIGLNMCEEWTHRLAQKLLLNTTRANQLLKLYVSGVVYRTELSLNTLQSLAVRYCILEHLTNDECSALLEWVLPSQEDVFAENWSSMLNCTDVIAQVAVALVVNGTAPHKSTLQEPPEVATIQQFYLLTAFEGGLCIKHTSPVQSPRKEQEGNTLCSDSGLVNKLLTLVTRDQFVMKDKVGTMNCSSTAVHVLSLHTSLLCSIIKTLCDWQFASNPRLEDYMMESCDILAEAVKQVLINKTEMSITLPVLERLRCLFRLLSTMPAVVAQNAVRRLVTEFFLRGCSALVTFSHQANQPEGDFDFFDATEVRPSNSSGSSEKSSPFDADCISGWPQIQLEAFKLLLECSRWNVSLITSLISLLETNNKSISASCSLQMALLVGRFACALPLLPEDVLERLFDMLQRLCREWHDSDSGVLAILDILQDLCSHVSDTEDSPDKYITLLNGLLRFVQRKKYGPEVSCRFVEVVGHLAQVDVAGEWSCRMSPDGSMGPFSHVLITFVNSPFHQVRMAACQMLWTLFQPSSSQRKQAFDELMEQAKEVFIISVDDEQDEVSEDDGVVRTATALHCLAAISTVNSSKRASTLLNYFLLTHEKNINTGLVRKSLTVVAEHMSIENTSDLVNPTLPFVFWNWHKKFNSISAFPWILIECTSEEEFYTRHLPDLVAVLIQRRDTAGLENVAAVLSQSVSAIVEACTPFLLGSILPSIKDEVQSETGKVILASVEQMIGIEKAQSLLISKLRYVIESLLSHLQDVEYLKSGCDQQIIQELPDSTNSFSAQLVSEGLKHIQDSLPSKGISLLVYLSVEKPRLIQKLLLRMYTKIINSKLPEYKLVRSHQFTFLCEMLADVVGNSEYRMANYTIRWVVRMLLHLVTAQSDVGIVVVYSLHRTVSKLVATHTSLLNSLLPLITTSLVPLANNSSSAGRQVLSLLNLLLVDHAGVLPAVAAIEPLPTNTMFATMREQYEQQRYSAPLSHSLRAEILHILENHNVTPQAKGLRHLKQQLSDKKLELCDLYKELRDSRGFSEDCEKSILHRLICLLIESTANTDPEIRYEAACCLGELGPADLTTLVLKPEVPPSSSEPLTTFLDKLLGYFVGSLYDYDVSVIQSTSDALYSLFLNFSHQLSSLLTKDHKDMFYPFISSIKRQRKVMAIPVDEDILTTVLELVCPADNCIHKVWITNLVSGLLNACQLSFLCAVCNLKADLCKQLLPLIVDMILNQSQIKNKIIELLVNQVNRFFVRHQNDANSNEIYNDRESVICMLSVVHIIRKHMDVEKIETYEWSINYLDISMAALSCSAYFSAVMFAELWVSELNSDREDLDSEGISQIEFIEDRDNDNGTALQKLLREAYIKIGEPDAVYGCGNSHLVERQTQIQHYEYEGRWMSVVEASDAQLSLDASYQYKGLEKALHYCGLYHLAGRASQSQSYETCWRLGQWSLPSPVEQSYEGLVYTVLQALHHSNRQRALQVVSQARTFVADHLSQSGLEAATSVYAVLAKLQSLQEVEDFINQDILSVADKWKYQDKIGWKKFTLVESIFAQRIALLKMNQSLDQEVCAGVLMRATEAARLEGFHAVAHSWLTSISSLTPLPDYFNYSFQLIQAQLYWDKHEPNTARYILRKMLGQLRDSGLDSLYARALQTYGSWVACTRTEQAQQILNKYLIPAVESSDDTFRKTSALCLAQYADAEYQTLLSYIKSSAYTSKIKHITESLNNAKKLTKAAEVSKKSADIDKQTRIDLQKTINLHDKQCKIDQIEVDNAQREMDNFLILSVKHYMLSLEIGDAADNLCIFRVVSLWMNNYSHTELMEELASNIDSIPSYKVLPVLPQLVARISDTIGDLSTTLLDKLIERCAASHPHHVLPLVMALANSYKDSDYTQSSLQVPNKPEPRVTAAKNMLSKMKHKTELKVLIKDMQTVVESYISLANLPQDSEKTSKVLKIPKSEPITKIKNFNNVFCPTVTMAVRISEDYTNIIGIQGFEETYYSVGGINVPKKIICICSDGVKRPQLVKGNDDLRQDAVMQQVFTIMNSLLNENKETRQRHLLIRTYKVVPLSQRSGVIEWCSNTMTLSQYLIGGGGVVGAHTRYREKDWAPTSCRRKIADAAAAKCSNREKLAVFKEVCSHFKPIFRHFFFENFANPGIWFERRLAYTHSVATSSMVGYILGIGDRHIMNILLDKQTAEVVHIDFGIAFEQGRTLVTPETIPFRLTRDIVDGMGVSGVEGVFRRSCEKTMVVLRECESTILTILEVLLYDPLYMWTITPAKAMAHQTLRQPQSQTYQAPVEGEVNKLAERALLRLKQKLQGIEEGSTTSIEGQVSKLIQEATNPVNLSRLFHGWQAHV